MTHDELQEDLARHLRGNTDRMVWTNTQLGPAGSPRPDVYTIDKSYANFKADAYEIKVTVSDLRHDITAGKWQKYMQFSHRVWFAFPRGLVPVSEIPRECGIILLGDGGWRTARKAVAQVLPTIPRDAWLKLLIESFPNSAVGHRTAPRLANDWTMERAIRKKLGDDAAELFRNRCNADESYQRETERRASLAQEMREETEKLREQNRKAVERQQMYLDAALQELGSQLGLHQDEITPKSLTDAIHELRNAMRGYNLPRTIEELQNLRKVLCPKKEGQTA
jgi:hypothetical protein